MKRILHIMSSMDRAGTETFVMNVFKNIDRSKVKFDFLVSKSSGDGYEEEATQLGASIFMFVPRRDGIRSHIKSLNDFFSKHASDYDAIHFHSNSFTSMLPVAIAKKHGIKARFVHCHSISTLGTHNKLLHRLNRMRISSLATHYLSCSSEASKWGYSGTEAYSKSIIIPNGIDLERYKFNSEHRGRIRRELGIEERFVIGNVSGFRTGKNHKLMLDILSDVKKEIPSSLLMFVGGGGNIEEIKKLAKEKKIEDSVLFLGFRNDVPQLMQAMDMFLFPSSFEGFGLVAIEAQTAGLPVLASDRISRETNLTELITYFPLEKPASEWARLITKAYPISSDRKFDDHLLAYDISSTCNLLLDLYEKI